MEPSGVLSNPQVLLEFSMLEALRGELLEKPMSKPCRPRATPDRLPPVLATITRVLKVARQPMGIREVHAAVQELLGAQATRSYVKGLLSAYATGGDRRFRRASRGCYELAVL